MWLRQLKNLQLKRKWLITRRNNWYSHPLKNQKYLRAWIRMKSMGGVCTNILYIESLYWIRHSIVKFKRANISTRKVRRLLISFWLVNMNGCHLFYGRYGWYPNWGIKRDTWTYGMVRWVLYNIQLASYTLCIC